MAEVLTLIVLAPMAIVIAAQAKLALQSVRPGPRRATDPAAPLAVAPVSTKTPTAMIVPAAGARLAGGPRMRGKGTA